jgi:hypothetical protein
MWSSEKWMSGRNTYRPAMNERESVEQCALMGGDTAC